MRVVSCPVTSFRNRRLTSCQATLRTIAMKGRIKNVLPARKHPGGRGIKKTSLLGATECLAGDVDGPSKGSTGPGGRGACLELLPAGAGAGAGAERRWSLPRCTQIGGQPEKTRLRQGIRWQSVHSRGRWRSRSSLSHLHYRKCCLP
jgi:hypothetical protein